VICQGITAGKNRVLNLGILTVFYSVFFMLMACHFLSIGTDLIGWGSPQPLPYSSVVDDIHWGVSYVFLSCLVNNLSDGLFFVPSCSSFIPNWDIRI
jgi:hypothetical protein